jgi:hypothetical protein
MIKQIEVTIRGDKKHQDVASFGKSAAGGWAVNLAGMVLDCLSI